jgi:predicted regulator of Ras-like GTPase activity (Roadblock/LC7/MglB family)
MVSIKEATANAIAFARDALGAERTQSVRLEEVESTTVDGKDAWLITLSMIAPPSPGHLDVSANMAEVLGLGRREYKTFTVIKVDGEVNSMKIRELANA